MDIDLRASSLFTIICDNIVAYSADEKMSSGASKIILEYVCPTLGVFVGNYMFYAPYQDVQKAVARGSLGDLNPLPWAFMLGNCAAWVLYSILIRNFFVFAGNLPGFFLAVWFNLAASKLQYQQQFTPLSSTAEQPAGEVHSAPRHDYWVMITVACWMGLISLIGFGDSISSGTKQLIVGLAANLNLSFFYGAPLSTIFTVIKERNTASIHFLTMVTNTANGIFWAAYGIAVLDYYIFVPNGLGALLGFVQFALYVLFPRKEAEDQMDVNKQVQEKPSTDDEEAPTAASGLTTQIVEESDQLETCALASSSVEVNAR